jgi:hypothetical protein
MQVAPCFFVVTVQWARPALFYLRLSASIGGSNGMVKAWVTAL